MLGPYVRVSLGFYVKLMFAQESLRSLKILLNHCIERDVLKLLLGFEYEGNVIYCSNSFSSPALSQKPRTKCMNACVTLRANIGLPTDMKPQNGMKNGNDPMF
jgi:hypothetical protein